MTPNEYQQLAARTECDQEAAFHRKALIDRGLRYDPGHEVWEINQPKLLATRLTHAALGLSGESGELSYAVEKWLQYGKPLDVTNIMEEIGDCLWYLALAANALGLNLEAVMKVNIKKLRTRYPDKYTDQCAAEENRDRIAEAAAMTIETDIDASAKDREYRALYGAKVPYNLIRDQTGRKLKQTICPNCKTPQSDRVGLCPHCGANCGNS